MLIKINIPNAIISVTVMDERDNEILGKLEPIRKSVRTIQ